MAQKQNTQPTKQTRIEDRSAKKYFSQIPHLARLLPMHPYTKLVYWDLKAIADQFAHDAQRASEHLKGSSIAARLRIAESMVSKAKRELVAFELISIEIDGRDDLIVIEDVWPRNIAHFSGSIDSMIDTPPKTGKSARKHVRKSPKNKIKTARSTIRKKKLQPLPGTLIVSGADSAAEPDEDSYRESFDDAQNDAKILIENLEDSYRESSQTTDTRSNSIKEVLDRVIEEEDAQAPATTTLKPDASNKVAAPNAPNPPRTRRPRKGSKADRSTYPQTAEDDARLSDARISAFNDFFGREKKLSTSEIDTICDKVLVTEIEQWRAACHKWATSVTASGNPYRITGADSLDKLLDYHLSHLRISATAAAPVSNTRTSSRSNKPTIGEIKAIPAPTGDVLEQVKREAEIKLAALLARQGGNSTGGHVSEIGGA